MSRSDVPSLGNGRSRVLGSGRHAWARVGPAHPSSRRGGSVVTPPKGRSGGVASTTRPPAPSPKARRRCSVQNGLPFLAEARDGRPPGVEHGNGGSRPKGQCKHKPQRDGGPSSRARACHPVQQPGPRSERCGAEALRPPVMGRVSVGPERNETRCAPKCTLRIIAFYPILVSAV